MIHTLRIIVINVIVIIIIIKGKKKCKPSSRCRYAIVPFLPLIVYQMFPVDISVYWLGKKSKGKMVGDIWNSHQKVQWINTRQYKPIFLWVFLINFTWQLQAQENKNVPATQMCLCIYVVFNWMEIGEGSWIHSSAGAYQSAIRGKGNLAETKKKKSHHWKQWF